MIKARIVKNKKTNQLSVLLPKTELKFLKNSSPKFVDLSKIKEEDFIK